MIDAHDRIRYASQIDHALHFLRSNDQVGNQNIAYAPGGHHFGLGQLSARNADCPRFDLLTRYGGHFVPLGMRTPGHSVAPAGVCHRTDIAFQYFQVKTKGRGIQGIFAQVQRNRSGSSAIGNHEESSKERVCGETSCRNITASLVDRCPFASPWRATPSFRRNGEIVIVVGSTRSSLATSRCDDPSISDSLAQCPYRGIFVIMRGDPIPT
jgi:hypothetical protein